jgi:pimeloyl-ACP methyl ester carboxylesterase
MNTEQPLAHSGRATTEGDELYYEVRGQGQPFLMISAGGGDGDSYAAVADLLCDEYKVITYDRRANARSTMNDPQNFEISQQSRLAHLTEMASSHITNGLTDAIHISASHLDHLTFSPVLPIL